MFEAASFASSMILSKALTQPLPWYGCVINSVFLFIYQTLDNLDGRQARRTGMSSPLGQFFDHGCDAITGVFEIIKSAAVLNLGANWTLFAYAILTGIGFVLASYEEYTTHRFYLGYFNAPDEGLLILMIVYLFIAAAPQCLTWFRPGFVIAYLISDLFTVLVTFKNVYSFVKDHQECKQRMKYSLIPTSITVSVICALAFFHQEYIHSVTFIMACEFILTFNSQTIIISYLVKRPPSKLFEPITFIFWFVALGSLLPSAKPYVESGVYWSILCGGMLMAMIITDLRVVYGFSKGLEIPAFRIKKQKIDEDKPAENTKQSERASVAH